ncbi:hypothetical protein [Labilibacter marinus]|uniref:hypothetical protein n=1 Tax=Labilibacter marinus TaxID=1477105 RepID=UPI00083668F9|nr:hypothetical protein [Labilibacter marinus]
MKKILSIVLFMMLTLGVSASSNFSEEKNKNTSAKEFAIELMNIAPEFKTMEDGRLEMSSAFMVTEKGTSNEWFGTFWADFNFNEGNAHTSYNTSSWKVSDVRLGEEFSANELKEVERILYHTLRKDFATISKNSVDDTNRISNHDKAMAFNNEAPLIIYSNLPSALVVIDGNPFYEELDKRYTKISNANAFVIKDNKKDIYYLLGGGLWFSSEQVMDGWEYQEKVPKRITKVLQEHANDLYESMNKEEVQKKIIPKIIVTSEPSELISTNGKPEYIVIPEANLIYAENTNADLFRDITTNKFYSLFSGRWFVSDRLEGNWEFLSAENLPDGFARIPEGHDKNSVLASVPGTKAAEDAVKNAQVPYVTKKSVATLLDTEVSYNGKPEFVKIEGTEISYAVNTSHPVMLWNSRYYLVEDAVWYNSSSPQGPWRIATQRPVGVEDIPASNPLFNLKYVYIYKQTESEVYTGYTSGYTGSYVDENTVVYGTGYQYGGWHGHYYYHHPMTYGFGFYYHPYYGWGPYYSPWYHSSFYWHWHWHMHWYYRPWYGHRPPYYRPPGYRPPGHRPPHHRPKPEHPIERPGNRPTQPIERPSTRPTQPSTRPSQPSTRPTQPSTRPSQPVYRPSQPSVRPSQPSMRPSQPTTRPSMPSTRPSPAPSRMR